MHFCDNSHNCARMYMRFSVQQRTLNMKLGTMIQFHMGCGFVWPQFSSHGQVLCAKKNNLYDVSAITDFFGWPHQHCSSSASVAQLGELRVVTSSHFFCRASLGQEWVLTKSWDNLLFWGIRLQCVCVFLGHTVQWLALGPVTSTETSD